MKRLLRVLFDFMLKVPYLPHFGLWLVEKVPALRSLILKVSGASAVIIENGQFKFYSASKHGYFDASSEQAETFMSEQAREVHQQLTQHYLKQSQRHSESDENST